MTHVLYKDLFVSHTLHHISTNLNRQATSFKQNLSEKIIFNALVLIVHRQDLFLFTNALIPTTAAVASSGSTSSRWILSQKLFDAHWRNTRIGNKFDKRQGIEATHVVNIIFVRICGLIASVV